MRRLLKIFLMMLCLSAQNSHATVEVNIAQPIESEAVGRNIPAISFFNEDNQMTTLGSVSQGKSVLLVPFYTHCTSACPLGVAHLKEVLKKSKAENYEVVLFSFNPQDTANDLKAFRKALRVPKEWSILRATPGETNRLLEILDFRYMTEGKNFVHPNTIIVLSPRLKITRFIQGLNYTTRTIDGALNDAKRVTRSLSQTIPLIFMTMMGMVLVATGFRGARKSFLKRELLRIWQRHH